MDLSTAAGRTKPRLWSVCSPMRFTRPGERTTASSRPKAALNPLTTRSKSDVDKGGSGG